MADGITFNVNIADVIKKINAIEIEVVNILENELDNFGELTVNDAKRLAPVDEGLLRNAIGYKRADLSVTITVNVDYAAYIEFGTKSFAAAYVSTLPSDWQAFAAQFKGKAGKGSMEEFVLRLTEWVIRKGFAAEKTSSGNRSKSKSSMQTQRQAAYAIAISILRKGIKPHPYLYPAYTKNIDLFIKNIKAAISK